MNSLGPSQLKSKGVPSVGEQMMRVAYVAVSKGGQGIVGNVASREELFSEFYSCYGSQHPNDSPRV
jgi:hypothetical protein